MLEIATLEKTEMSFVIYSTMHDINICESNLWPVVQYYVILKLCWGIKTWLEYYSLVWKLVDYVFLWALHL